MAGIESSSAATSLAFSTRGRRCGFFGELSSSAGLSSRAPISIWLRNRPRSAASLRAIVAGAIPRSDRPAA